MFFVEWILHSGMATILRFEDLEIWQLAREQSKAIYILTLQGSFKNDYALKNQINAAAGSSMDNIAEGFERFSNKEFSQFLIISKGSNGEVQSQLYRAFDRKHISKEILELRLNYSKVLGKKIKTLIDYLKSCSIKIKPIKIVKTMQ
jgi:four helix bundle protein